MQNLCDHRVAMKRVAYGAGYLETSFRLVTISEEKSLPGTEAICGLSSEARMFSANRRTLDDE